MSKEKIDGVVESVHYSPDGQIAYVRAYQRRGSTFSDVVLIKRDELIKLIHSGKQYFTGERIYRMGSDFKTFEKLQVVPSGEGEVILTSASGSKDTLVSASLL
jgi:hypothetical protein